MQGQHPKLVFYLVFSCWGQARINAHSILVPVWAQRSPAERQGNALGTPTLYSEINHVKHNRGTTGKRSRHHSLSRGLPCQLSRALQVTRTPPPARAPSPGLLQAVVAASRWCFLPSVRSLHCSMCEGVGADGSCFSVPTGDLWEVHTLFAFWINQRGCSGRTEDVRSSDYSRVSCLRSH